MPQTRKTWIPEEPGFGIRAARRADRQGRRLRSTCASRRLRREIESTCVDWDEVARIHGDEMREFAELAFLVAAEAWPDY